MSVAEIRARELFNALNLIDENEDVRRNLMILLLTVPQKAKQDRCFTEKFAGKWQGDESAEDILSSIRESRTINREIVL